MATVAALETSEVTEIFQSNRTRDSSAIGRKESKRFSNCQGGSENSYLNYLQKLAADIKNTPEDILKENMTLRVGDDTEVGDKAVFQITGISKDVIKWHAGEER
ncbi:hypothetical protein TNCV_1708631 [Trichonephila clavipes]|nr:hypothetical protein TNCV_1708631 [Trichonephila clavipes]